MMRARPISLSVVFRGGSSPAGVEFRGKGGIYVKMELAKGGIAD